MTKEAQVRRLGGGEKALPPRGERRILSAIEVVFASRSMVYLTGRSRVFIEAGSLFLFRCAVYTMRDKMAVGAAAAFRSTMLDSILRRCTDLFPVSSSFEWHHFVDRLAHCSPAASPAPRHRDGKAKH